MTDEIRALTYRTLIQMCSAMRSAKPITRELLDAHGRQEWLIVEVTRERRGVVETVTPLDEHLWRLHQPPAAEPSP